MKKLALLLFAAALALQNCTKDEPAVATTAPLSDTATADRGTVTLPAGSHNALAAAVAQAGPGGTVILATGDHTETGTVTIPHTLSLVGQNGAVLRGKTTPTTREWVAEPQLVEPVLHFKNAPGSKVANVEISTISVAPGNTGILIEDSDRFRLEACSITNYQKSVLVVRSSSGRIEGCRISGSRHWETGAFFLGDGIGMVSGSNNTLVGNEVTNHLTGVFLSGKNGLMQKNYIHDGPYTGVVLCTYPKAYFELPGGEKVGAEHSAQNWRLIGNKVTKNGEDGILVIDGANGNILLDNESVDNGINDINLTGDLPDYLWVTFPPSEHNLVKSTKYPGTRIMDCGKGNVIVGGKQLPCQ